MTRGLRLLIQPIGFVRTSATDEDVRKHSPGAVSEIVLNKKYAAGLKGIEEYSHVFVVFWLHKVSKDERGELLIRSKNVGDRLKVGIFSTRRRNHPNPIALTVVQLVQRKSNILKVKGLDAFNGSPVLDLKPFNHRDIPRRIRVPMWAASG